jgi:hypothetical protein
MRLSVQTNGGNPTKGRADEDSSREPLGLEGVQWDHFYCFSSLKRKILCCIITIADFLGSLIAEEVEHWERID